MFLMAHDSDGFNRWDASQTLASRVILDLVAQQQRGESLTVSDHYTAAFKSAMQSSSAPALLAEVLALPSEGYLGDQMQVADVDAIHVACQTLRQHIAQALQTELFEMLANLQDTGAYEITPEAIGRRSLKNLLLSWLMAGDSAQAKALCLAQYAEKHNMTDVIAALALIADSDLPERQQVLDDFAQQWQHDPLVMDKWFVVQAVSSRQDTLQSVQTLCEHAAFSMMNPNKVYSLILRFASGNPVRFHAADGAGYRFVVDKVLELNKLNPQVASRIIRSLSSWHNYDEGRQEKIRAQLQRVVDAPDISKNVFEIASKSLAE